MPRGGVQIAVTRALDGAGALLFHIVPAAETAGKHKDDGQASHHNFAF